MRSLQQISCNPYHYQKKASPKPMPASFRDQRKAKVLDHRPKGFVFKPEDCKWGQSAEQFAPHIFKG